MELKNSLTIAIVTGEESGDILGAGLMNALRRRLPGVKFIGIGGRRMIDSGFESIFPQDRLAVMGLVEPLRRLPELLSIRRTLIRRFIAIKPAVVIGIDSPDFNLGLELAVRQAGLKTAHYVSPSVWAWRRGRIKKIARAVDLMLTLFPFEEQFYRDHRVPVRCVGHPLADQIPLQVDSHLARRELGVSPVEGEKVVALMPGSRETEVRRMAELFFDAADELQSMIPAVRFLVPSANERRHVQLQEILVERRGNANITLISGQSLRVMTAADAVLMASGTTTLEAMLLKKPMVIAYKVAPLSYWLFKKLVKVPYIGLPNLLAGQSVAPEFIQQAATPESLAEALCERLTESAVAEDTHATFVRLHRALRRDADESAAEAILNLLEGPFNE